METFGYIIMAFMGGLVGWFTHKILHEKGKVE